MQLPFVLQSAETMKAAVAHLEPHMEKLEGRDASSKGKFLIATVKGDVHDIGKNLVDIILTNNGYEVINLGIEQPVEAIVEAQRLHQADCIAMSGLLVKSTAFMKDNLEAFNAAGINVPVILGGAALTPRFVNGDCREAYRGQVIYGRDAFADLRFMDALMDGQGRRAAGTTGEGFLDGAARGTGLWSQLRGDAAEPAVPRTESGANGARCRQRTQAACRPRLRRPTTPFRSGAGGAGSDSLPSGAAEFSTETQIALEEVFAYLDRNALFAGQWQLRKAQEQSREDYEAMLAEPRRSRCCSSGSQRCLERAAAHPAGGLRLLPLRPRGQCACVVFDPAGHR
jgi:5-methyltetrahydrofolate--homocysteine methyltransferase